MGKHNKKRRHRRHSSKQYAPNLNRQNTHHILWVKAVWNKNKYSFLLRDHWYMKILIPEHTLHKEIHASMDGIPVPKEQNCRMMLGILEDLDDKGILSEKDSFKKRLEILIFALSCIEPDTEKALKKQLRIVNEFYAKPH